jgi:DNA polymerase III alpha subunit
MQEIIRTRPYNSLHELFFDNEGRWRHSKVNKTALSSLCKIEAFGSLEDMKTGKVENHRQLLAMMTEGRNYDSLRKGAYGVTKTQAKRAKKNGEILVPIINRLRSEYSDLPDWTRQEKIVNYVEMTSGVDAELVFPPELMSRVRKKDITSVHEIESGSRGVGWFCISEIIKKKTKNGKDYYRLKIINDDYQTTWLRVWGQMDISSYTLWLADVHHDANWGFSTSAYKMKRISAFD